MIRLLHCVAVVCCGLVLACTSSNNVSGTAGGSSNYDSKYRQSTSTTKPGTGGDKRDAPEGDPPITLMLMAMETGDVYPGEDYYVYAVADNPDNRDLQYVWSVANGTISDVPEVERGRLLLVVEEEYDTASPVDVTKTSETPAEETPATESPEGQPPAPGTTPDKPAPETKPGTGGEQPSTEQPAEGDQTKAGDGTSTTGPPDEYDPFANTSGGSSTGNSNQSTSGKDIPEEELNKFKDSISDASPDLQELLIREFKGETLTEAEQARCQEYRDKKGGRKAQAPAGTGFYLASTTTERRIVAGPDDADYAEETEVSSDRDQDGAAANVGEDEVPAGIALPYDDDAQEAGRGSSLRTEYQAWEDDSTSPRRRNLGTYGGDEEMEPVEAEESYEISSLVTEDPFILWEPLRQGTVRIYCKIVYKDEDITEPRYMEVDVRLRDPEVEMSEDFPDMVREDDSYYVKIDGINIPSFNKGLFTLTFDNTKLSFRDAELGEFFDDAGGASLYFAQPNKNEGRVLLAVDSNTELIELGGDGTIMYCKFKAKENLETREEADLAMVLDTSARYILDRDGTNILPLPVERPPYRTDLTMPPVNEGYERETTPPGTKAQQPAATQAAPAGQTDATGTVQPAQSTGGGRPVGSNSSATGTNGQSNRPGNTNQNTQAGNNNQNNQSGQSGQTGESDITSQNTAFNPSAAKSGSEAGEEGEGAEETGEQSGEDTGGDAKADEAAKAEGEGSNEEDKTTVEPEPGTGSGEGTGDGTAAEGDGSTSEPEKADEGTKADETTTEPEPEPEPAKDTPEKSG